MLDKARKHLQIGKKFALKLPSYDSVLLCREGSQDSSKCNEYKVFITGWNVENYAHIWDRIGSIF